MSSAAFFGPLVAVLALPFLLSVAAAALQHVVQRRLEQRAQALPLSTGRWVQERIVARGLPVDVGVHPDDAGGADGYWAGVDFIALTERTWARRDASGWAVGAHELGHALNALSHPAMGTVLPVARLVAGWTGHAFAAMLLVSALYGSPGAMWATFAVGALALAATAVVVVDEAMASVHAHHMLVVDPRVSRAALADARASLLGAFTVYAAQLAGRVAIIAGWAWVMPLAAGPPLVPGPPGALGMWILVAASPFLVLRVVHVLWQVIAPEPVQSEFRLATVAQTESGWDFLAAVSVLALVGTMYDLSSHPAYIGAVMLAAVPAMGPVAALGRLPVLLPLLVVFKLLLRRSPGEGPLAEWMREERVPSDAAPASLLDFHSNPPWYLRASWLLRIAFLPLLVGLILALAAGQAG